MEYIVEIPKINDINQLLELNEFFLIDNLNPEQREKGFIRIRYSYEDFEKMILGKEIVVAYNLNKIVAYYLIGRKATTPMLAYQKNMAHKIEVKREIKNEKIGYGCQVCITKDFRHFGLFRNMLLTLKKSVKDKYDYLLCSISDKNTASLKAHKKNDWKFVEKIDTTNFFILKT